MPSVRETALQSLTTVIRTAVDPVTVLRNEPRPQEVAGYPRQALLIVGDGDPGIAEQTLGVKSYFWTHSVELEIIVQRGDSDLRAEEIDDLASSIGSAVTADTTLGGTVQYVRPGGVLPTHDQDDAGTVPYGVGLMLIELWYETDTPTG